MHSNQRFLGSRADRPHAGLMTPPHPKAGRGTPCGLEGGEEGLEADPPQPSDGSTTLGQGLPQSRVSRLRCLPRSDRASRNIIGPGAHGDHPSPTHPPPPQPSAWPPTQRAAREGAQQPPPSAQRVQDVEKDGCTATTPQCAATARTPCRCRSAPSQLVVVAGGRFLDTHALQQPHLRLGERE